MPGHTTHTTYTVIQTWTNAAMRLLCMRDLDRVRNSSTGEWCFWGKHRPGQDPNFISLFLYDFTAGEVERMNNWREVRSPFRVDLVEVDRGGSIRQQLNLYPTGVMSEGDRLTIHKDPSRLKGRVISTTSLFIQPYQLVHTKVGA